jgi:uracil-DNA glycosylase
MVQPEKIAHLQAASIIDWWKTAGVDYQTSDQPFNWLQDNDNNALISMSANTAVAPLDKTKNPLPKIPQSVSSDWPVQISVLVTELASGANLPGNRYGGKSAAPVGGCEAKLMIISDLPDNEDIDNGELGRGPSGKLLQQMLAVTGENFADCYLTALAHSRPATGDIPQADLPDLAEFALHQMKLVNPDMVLILGSVACQALLNAELMTARGSLHYFNHNGQKVSAIVSFHPRTLLARPILKAQAWKDLQMLKIKDAL